MSTLNSKQQLVVMKPELKVSEVGEEEIQGKIKSISNSGNILVEFDQEVYFNNDDSFDLEENLFL